MSQPNQNKKEGLDLNFKLYTGMEEKNPLDLFYTSKEQRQKLENIVTQMSNSMAFRMFGVAPNQSYLLTGPPGTGKTYSVELIAKELASRKTEGVAVLRYDIGQQGSRYINQNAVNMQSFFDAGQKLIGQNKMGRTINHIFYFFDEADALVGSRGEYGNKEDDKVLETMMKNLQYIDDRGDNEYVFMTTNHPQLFDKAVLRSGRINEKLQFDLPNQEAREALFRGHISNHNMLLGYNLFYRPQVNKYVTMTEGFNCADIKRTVEDSIRNRLLEEYNKPEAKQGEVIEAYKVHNKNILDVIVKIKKEKDPQKKRMGFI